MYMSVCIGELGAQVEIPLRDGNDATPMQEGDDSDDAASGGSGGEDGAGGSMRPKIDFSGLRRELRKRLSPEAHDEEDGSFQTQISEKTSELEKQAPNLKVTAKREKSNKNLTIVYE